MGFPIFDDLHRPRLEWPEPLLFDLIVAAYGTGSEAEESASAARLHVRFLRALMDGETERSGPLRIELIACCAARRISPESIAGADLAVFRELSGIIDRRFRHSPRLRVVFLHRLHRSIGALAWRNAAAGWGPAPRNDARLLPEPRHAAIFTD